MRIRLLLAGIGGSLVIAIVVAAFIWDAARKEIVFLCPNFSAGVTEQSVMRQLNTGNFLRYEKETNSTIEHLIRITADSAYNFGQYQCVIELDQNQLVIKATVH